MLPVPDYADNAFTVEAAANRLRSKFPSTGGWHRWQRKSFGTIEVPGETNAIVLRSDGPIKGEAVVRVKKGSPMANQTVFAQLEQRLAGVIPGGRPGSGSSIDRSGFDLEVVDADVGAVRDLGRGVVPFRSTFRA